MCIKRIILLGCILVMCTVYSACGNNVDDMASVTTELSMQSQEEEIPAEQLQYDAAIQFMQDGEYERALEAFSEIDDYEDAGEKISECHYNLATKAEADSDLDTAMNEYALSGDYKDSEGKYRNCRYQLAMSALEDDDLDATIELLTDLDYEDSAEILEKTIMEKGMREHDDYKFLEALEASLVSRHAASNEGVAYDRLVNAEMGKLDGFQDGDYCNEWIAYYAKHYLEGLVDQKEALELEYSENQIKWQEGLVKRYQVVNWLYTYFGVFEDNQEVIDNYVYQLETQTDLLAFYKAIDEDLLIQLDGYEAYWINALQCGMKYTNKTEHRFTVTFFFYLYDGNGQRIGDDIVTYQDVQPGQNIEIAFLTPGNSESFEFFWEIFE